MESFLSLNVNAILTLYEFDIASLEAKLWKLMFGTFLVKYNLNKHESEKVLSFVIVLIISYRSKQLTFPFKNKKDSFNFGRITQVTPCLQKRNRQLL
ncbi:hypothetical protein RclHR1_03000008 [Rhizophagus clarus]|uniref:Uncharacterized protein n=1 Tax=Rhizophagus clarus TaxID=94130 RepID=A0A2Z6R605_9GLOM|nr:hypothetical protein RclHR1_03000008 [Rhizophagus clarus]